MKTSLSSDRISEYVQRQLNHFFPDGSDVDMTRIATAALERIETCFAPVRLRSYQLDGEPYFNHLHSDHYATFLYLASHVAFLENKLNLAAKLYSLNKALNGFMCTYDTILPPHFLIIHTVGMLLGKATYSDYFVALHGATIGTDRGVEPSLGKCVVIYGGSSVLGNCNIGDNVSIAAHTLIRNQSAPAHHVVAGISPDLLIRPARRALIHEYYIASKLAT